MKTNLGTENEVWMMLAKYMKDPYQIEFLTHRILPLIEAVQPFTDSDENCWGASCHYGAKFCDDNRTPEECDGNRLRHALAYFWKGDTE